MSFQTRSYRTMEDRTVQTSNRTRKRPAQSSLPNVLYRTNSSTGTSIRALPSNRHSPAGRQASDSLFDRISRGSIRLPQRALAAGAHKLSAGWDKIGDDDELYIQSDDPHPNPWNVSEGSSYLRNSLHSTNNQPSSQHRKRKRANGQPAHPPTLQSRESIPMTRSHPIPSSLGGSRAGPSNSKHRQSGAPTDRQSSPTSITTKKGNFKYDPEGCANCLIHQSTCWWKKKKPFTHPDGTESWDEEKLCNSCSIHWNKNGYHRNLKKTKSFQSIDPAIRPEVVAKRMSDSHASRSSTVSSLPIGLSSPTASLTKPPSAAERHLRRLRSPSQLTLAAEREAQILKRSLSAVGNRAQSSYSKGHNSDQIRGASEDEEFGVVMQSPPKSRTRAKLKGKSLSNNLDQLLTVSSGKLARSKPPPNIRQFAPRTSRYNLDDHLARLENEHDPQHHTPSPTLDAYLSDTMSPSKESGPSPPRTPPPTTHKRPPRPFDPRPQSSSNRSPNQSFDIDNLLSPSFLNASPNSLLRKLNPQKSPLNETEAEASTSFSGSLVLNHPFDDSSKVFSPSRRKRSTNLVPIQAPTGEPSKRSDLVETPPMIGPSVLIEGPMGSGSSGKGRASIFAASHPSSSKSADLDGVDFLSSTRINSMSVSRGTAASSSKTRKLKRTDLDYHNHDGRAGSSTQRLDVPLDPYSTQAHTSDSSGRKSKGSANLQQLTKSTKNLMARTIWSRRLEAKAVSSEDPQFDDIMTVTEPYHSPLESCPSDLDMNLMPMEGCGQETTGLSSAISRRLNPSLSTSGMSRGHDSMSFSDMNNLLPPSSPPVLPPPSDCSEGITPHSGMPFSDGLQDLPEVNKFGSSTRHLNSQRSLESQIDYDLPFESLDHHKALLDITPSVNQRPSQETQLDGLSPEIVSALSDAIKAGWSADELAKALRNIHSRSTSHSDKETNGENSKNMFPADSQLSSMGF